MALQDVQESKGTSTRKAPETIEVRPVSIHAGAEIHGVDLSKSLTEQQTKEIREALLQWKVVFFRDQHMTHEQHIDFARHFGQPTPGHVVFGNDDTYPEIYSIAKHRTANSHRGQALRPWSGWHADITSAINPPFASILRGDTVPPYGGDTQWTNLVAAYNALSPTMQGIVDGLRGVHRSSPPAGAKATKEYEERVRARTMISEHPLVRVHPATGRKALYLGRRRVWPSQFIEGLSNEESEALLDRLWAHATQDKYRWTHEWRVGDFLVWDNRCAMHYRDPINASQRRVMWRSQFQGEEVIPG